MEPVPQNADSGLARLGAWISGRFSALSDGAGGTALWVSNDSDAVTRESADAFGLWLAERLGDSAAIEMPSTKESARFRRMPAVDRPAELLSWARARHVARLVTVAIEGLETELADDLPEDLSRLRVQSTLYVSWQVVEMTSGNVIRNRTMVLCRRTRPVVRGTRVGVEVVDALLKEICAQIASQWSTVTAP